MICARCRTVLADWRKACPACGTPVSRSAGAARADGAGRRWVLAWLLVSAAVILFALVLPVARRLPLSWWTIPLVREVLARARDHPGVLRAIGEPVRLRGLVTGEVRADETGWREFLIRVPVGGPRGAAALSVRAGRIGRGPWSYATLELASDAGDRVDVLEPPRAAAPGDPGGRRVFLVPLGRLERVSLDELVHFYRARLGLAIQTRPALTPPAALFDRTRQQLVAEGVADWLRGQLP